MNICFKTSVHLLLDMDQPVQFLIQSGPFMQHSFQSLSHFSAESPGLTPSAALLSFAGF